LLLPLTRLELALWGQIKLLRPPNTDGMGNCLQQPGQLSNQLHKSIDQT